jgi:hypothetical protein
MTATKTRFSRADDGPESVGGGDKLVPPPVIDPEHADKPAKVRELPYKVAAGRIIAPFGNGSSARFNFGDRARKYTEGEVVHLTPAMARHYVKMRALDPYIPDDDEAE